MKTLLLASVMATVVSFSAFAGHAVTALHIQMFDGRPIKIVLDNIPYGVKSEHDIFDLAPGKHKIRILARTHHGGHMPLTLIYKGQIQIKPGFAAFAVVDRWNRLIVEGYEPILPPAPPAPPVHSFPPVHGHHPGYPQFPHGYDDDCVHNEWQHPQVYPLPMHQNDFNQLMQIIRSKAFDSTREDIAKGAIASNYFTSQQVRQMLELFTFESTRMSIAKKAYDKVVDQQNYFVVYDAFTFESSIHQLEAYLR